MKSVRLITISIIAQVNARSRVLHAVPIWQDNGPLMGFEYLGSLNSSFPSAEKLILWESVVNTHREVCGTDLLASVAMTHTQTCGVETKQVLFSYPQ